MGTISKEGAGCFWTFWGIGGIYAGIQTILQIEPWHGTEHPLIVGLLMIAASILFIKYAGRSFLKIFKGK